MTRAEVTYKRPTVLSGVFRKHDKERLADWTRHVDCDWRWYCSYCGAVVILIEEKLEESLERSWNVTKRAAVKSLDRPWAWLVICLNDGRYEVVSARTTESATETHGPRQLDEDTLIAWIERAFLNHYRDAGHPEHLIPERLR